jgi:hypothetical protein
MESIVKEAEMKPIKTKPKLKKLVIVEEFTQINETPNKPKVLTEDLGKIFEMSICLLYNIQYDGKYSYSMEDAQKIKIRIAKLLEVFPHSILHTAKSGARYDFTGLEDNSIRLSAKTTKKDGKIAPQVVGQPSKKKFCEFFQLDPGSFDLTQIKIYIEQTVKNLLAVYEEYTFDCPTIYYNKKSDKLLFIRKVKYIPWSQIEVEFSHNKKNKVWNESTTVCVDGVTIGEFQIHNHRDCIKFRWAFEKLLYEFPDCFEVTEL